MANEGETEMHRPKSKERSEADQTTIRDHFNHSAHMGILVTVGGLLWEHKWIF